MTLRWTRRALRDLQHLHDYIAEDNPVAARRTIARIRDASKHLRRHSHMGKPGRVAETRELSIAETPCIIAYRIADPQVQIVAVLHSRQQWPERFDERD